MANKRWIAGATKNAHGQFAAAAKRAGVTTRQYASKVLANPDRYSPKRRKQAHLAKTLMRVGRK